MSGPQPAPRAALVATWVTRAGLLPAALLLTTLPLASLLGTAPAHAVAIKDLAKETPRQREARDQLLVGNHQAVVNLLSSAALKTRKPTPPERALLGRALVGLGQLSAARSALKPCKTKPICALTWGRIELNVGDRRAALKVLGAAFKRHPKHVQLRVAFGEALYAVGQGYQARQVLDPLADRYAARQISELADMVAVARSLALNGFFKDANQVLADANEAVANKHERKLVELAWAQLFLSKSNYRDADTGFRKVLAIDPHHIAATIGMVRIDLDSDHTPRKAKKRLDKALKHSPTDPRLLTARAEVALMDEDLAAARALLDRALKVSPRHATTLAVRYATCVVGDDRRCAKKALKTNLKANAHDPQPHLVAARYLEAAHRYDEVLRELKTALKRDPDSAAAHAALGMSYARLADDKQAFAHLDTAFRTDGFNVRTANVLNVLYDGVLRYMPVIKGEFVDLRVHRKDRLALERTVLPFLQESFAGLKKKYAMTPKPPVRVEIFPTTEQFSVRTVGLPNLGAHAVCFGHLITSRSPVEKAFNWKMVLHHELAHVFHIQATNGRVPRWLTEGLAMMESAWLNPRYDMHLERRVYSRLKSGKLAKIRDFNLAFSQARSMAEIVDAYYQAMMLTRYLNNTYGFTKLRKLVAAHRSGASTAKLVKRVFGVTPERLDADFAAWLRKELERYERDFRPDRTSLRALLKADEAGKAGKVGAKPGEGDPTLNALREALRAMASRNPRRAARLLRKALGEPDTPPTRPTGPTRGPQTTPAPGKGNGNGNGNGNSKGPASADARQADLNARVAAPHRCTVAYLLTDIALARRDWRRVAELSRALIAQPNGRCDGVRQRLLLARALRALGDDRRTAVLRHLRAANAIDPTDASVLRVWLAALPEGSPEAERRRLLREILALSPNEAVLGARLATLAWRRLHGSLEAQLKLPAGALAPQKARKRSNAKTAKTTKTTKPPAAAPLSPAARRALIADVARGAEQLEETAPHTFVQALWEARTAVARGHLKMALPVYRLAAERATRKVARRTAWCELALIAQISKAKDAQGEAERRCKAER